MGDVHKKRKKHRHGRSTKSWRFWAIFVAAPIIVTLCSLLAVYEFVVKERFSDKQHFEKGIIYTNLNRHTEAIAEFKKELEKHPENEKIHYHLGISYFKLKKYDQAVTEFNRALKIKPNYSDAHLQLAVIYMAEAIELRKMGKSESLVLETLLEAEDVCREIFEKDPKYAQAYVLLGDIHSSQGLLDDAIIDYKHVLKIDNSFVDGHIALVRLYINKGELDMAEKECNLILSEFEPDNSQARFLLSKIYEQKGKYDEAVVFLKRILEKRPENITAHMQLGLLYLKLSKFDDAFSEAEQVSVLRPSALPPAVYFIKGSVFLQRGDHMKAVSLLREATLKLPELVETHYILAHALVAAGRLEEAKTEFKTAIDLAPEFIPAQLGLARILSRVGWQKEAIELCMNILEIESDNVEAMQMLGMAYVRIHDFKNAEEQFRHILELNPSVGDINMAYLSLASGQLSKCIRQCEAIIRINPDERKIYDILGIAHIRRGDFDRGIEQFKKDIELNPNSSTSLLNLAKAYVITEKIEEAKKTLENAITINPDNLNARTMLAGLYERESNIDKAAEILEQTIEIKPDYIEGYALAGIYFLQGKIGESIDLCNKALKLDPENAVFFINLAISYQQKENYDAAIKYCKKAIELKPENISLKLFLTNIYTANGEYGKAKDQIESISAFNDNQKKAYLELLDLCRLNYEKGRQIALALNKVMFTRYGGLSDLAISECKKAIGIFPENIVPKVILADTYLSTGRNEEAIEIYSEIIEDKPEFASSYYNLGRAYLLADKPDEAISTYQDMIGKNSKSILGRLALAGLLIKKGNSDKAAEMIENVIELDPEYLMAHNLFGEVNLANENYEKAETEFTKMIELRSDTFEGHFNMARLKFSQGDYDKCIEHCETALQTRPVDVRIHNILGMAYMKKGMLDDAVLEFNKIIDINSDFVPAYLNIASINMAAKKPETAAFLYKAALKIKPDSVEARFGLGNSYALMGNHSESINEFRSIMKEYPDHVNVYISLARSYLALGNNSKAQEAAMDALSIDTENSIAGSLLAKIYVRKEEVTYAIKQLKRILSRNTKNLEVYDLGTLYMDIGEYDNAVLVYNQGVENFPGNAWLWCNLAIAYQMKKDLKGAKDACIKALNIQPDGIMPNLCMISISLSRGEFENARRRLKGMLNVNDRQKYNYLKLIELCNQNTELADKVSHHLSRAFAYTNNRWFNRVLKECSEIIKIAPANTVAYNVQLDILVMTGENDRAIEVCRKIIELEPESSEIYNKLARIYNSKGAKDKAIAQFRKAISINQNNVTAYLNLGVLMESKNFLDESIDAYKKVIELDPTSPVAYNNLAWLYASKMQDKLGEALKLAEKAKELTQNNPAVIDTLGWIYYLSGLYDEALVELRTAAQSATWNPTIRYHLGIVYYKMGFQREALVEVERALKINSTFPEAEEAKEIIQKIIVSRIKDTGRE